mmetsp:Transcript_67521/g.213719  ORF Transcript_67521/g.213719 Transcript_67521/m.213719 type:complete len:144 (+) Transcript_67521:134-565(+)
MVAANKKLAGKTKPHLRALLDNPRWGLMMICLLFLDVLCVIAELLIEVNVVCKIVEDDYDKLEKEKDYADNHSDSPYGDDKEAPHRRSRNLLFHVVHQLSDPMVMHHLSGCGAPPSSTPPCHTLHLRGRLASRLELPLLSPVA